MNVLLFAGSLRQDSFNKKLTLAAQAALVQNSSLKLKFLDLRDLNIPLYDGDLEAASGLPSGVVQLSDEIKNSHALIIASPEYNGSISGVLKNALDWVSRTKPNPISGKACLLMAASPGALGGIRTLWHTRVPFEALGAHVYPEMFGLSKAHTAFNEHGHLIDASAKEKMETLLNSFIRVAEKISQ